MDRDLQIWTSRHMDECAATVFGTECRGFKSLQPHQATDGLSSKPQVIIEVSDHTHAQKITAIPSH